METHLFYLSFFISTFFIRQFYADLTENRMKIRLPDILEPIKYEIDLYTNSMTDPPHFYGEVTITIKCAATTKQIILNKNSLDIDAVKVWLNTDKGEYDIKVIDKDESLGGDQILLKLNENLEKDHRYEVKIKYHKAAFYSKDLGYIFRSYKSASNIHSLAYTRMNEVEASRVIPCWDQIGIKAKFIIRHRHPASLKSFSNAKKIVDSESVDEPIGWVVDKFADVDSMSTFSVAFVVADYDSIGPAKIPAHVPDIEIKIWAETNALKLMNKFLGLTARCYVFFSNIFRIPHKLGKLDMIVAPQDDVDVQDSYGLIILRQYDVLQTYYESDTNLSQKHSTILKICYAISRQWIGHSVTMLSWSETWVHFGLNTFLQNLCIDDLYPELRFMSKNLLVEAFFVLLRNEDRGDYNPVLPLGPNSFFTSYTNRPHTSSKVHQVIRMLSLILDPEKDVFRKSLENYVRQYESKNTNANNTWEIFTQTANDEDGNLLPEGITVKKIMDSWLTQKGHPHIYVKIDKKNNEIIVTQEYLNYSQIGKKEIADPVEKKCWLIPLIFTTKEKMEFQKVKVHSWLDCHTESVRIKNVNVNEWIIFNLKLYVPCRVHYEDSIWLSIRETLLNGDGLSQIDFLTRSHLMSDMFAFAEAEKLPYEFLFKTLEYLKYEDNFDCWKVVISELQRIKARWTGTELLYSSYMQYVRDMLRPVLKKKILKETILTFEDFLNSKSQKTAVENLIIMAACTFEAYECVQLAQKLQSEWKAKTFGEYNKLIPDNLRDSVYCLAVKSADKKELKFLYESYNWKKEPKSPMNKLILTALGCSSKTENLHRYWKWGMTFEDSRISPELKLKVFESLSSNELAYPLIINYLRNDFDQLDEYLEEEATEITIEYFLVKVIEVTKVQSIYDELIKMLPSNGRENLSMANKINESKSKAERNISWLQRKKEDVLLYFMGPPK